MKTTLDVILFLFTGIAVSALSVAGIVAAACAAAGAGCWWWLRRGKRQR